MNQSEENKPADRIHFEEAPSPATWDYQPDPEVVEVLEETEDTAPVTGDLKAERREYNDESPRLSGGDVDADWERAESGGEETVGGSVATPDQDRVDELGQAWGVEYQDDEPIHTIDKLEKRDRERWELNPASKDQEESS